MDKQTRLSCSAMSCIHNSDHCCCKNEISVDGKDAKDCCETCCATFSKRGEGTFQNSFETPNNALHIRCEAENCVYNQNKVCQADQIGITGGNANDAAQTACATFKMR